MGIFRRLVLPGRSNPASSAPHAGVVDPPAAGRAPRTLRPIPAAERKAALELLDQEHLMTLAVLGPDGGPRVMTVGFLHEDLDIFLVTGRDSDKLAAIRSDPRVAMAVRHEIGAPGDGLSLAMTGRAEEVLDPVVAERVNQTVRERYRGGHLYCPQQHSVAIIQIRPVTLVLARARNGRSVTDAYDVSRGVIPGRRSSSGAGAG